MSSGLGHRTRFICFSSRRRHTRFKCDWSSDVCSSDLWREGAEPTNKCKLKCMTISGADTAPVWFLVARVVLARQAARCAPKGREIGRASCREGGEGVGVAGTQDKERQLAGEEGCDGRR